jgi:hypothetical protein
VIGMFGHTVDITPRGVYVNRMSLKFFFLCFVYAPILVGCRDGQLVDLRGRYQGKQILTTGGTAVTKQVIVQVPGFLSVNGSNVLRFKTYATTGKSVGTAYQLTVLNKDTLQMEVPSFLSGASILLKLKKDSTCASGVTSKAQVNACWVDGTLNFKIIDLQGRGRSLVLALTKDDGLPPPRDTLKPIEKYSLDELMGRARFLNYGVFRQSKISVLPVVDYCLDLM